MAQDFEARETGSSGLAIGLVALVLIAAIAGFVFLRPGAPTEVAVVDRGTPDTTIVNPPANPPTVNVNPPAVNVNPPAVNINPPAAPAAPASGAGSEGGSKGSGE